MKNIYLSGLLHAALIILLLLLGLTGCDRSIDGVPRPGVKGPVPGLTAPTTNLAGGQTSSWTAYWIGGQAPYTIAWDFGGGAANIEAKPGVSPVNANATWNDSTQASTYIVEAIVTDALGLVGSATTTVTIAPTPNTPPVIESVVVANSTLTVEVTDSDGDEVTVTLSDFSGATFDMETKIADASGMAVFPFSLAPLVPDEDGIIGATGSVTVTADDGRGGIAVDQTASFPYVIPPFVPAADTLYAIPMANSVAIDEPATILIYTGETAHPFQFISVGVVIDGGGRWVPLSTNFGALGGDRNDADGVWADITTDDGWMLMPDVFFMPGPDPEGTLPEGSVRYDFHIVPLGGIDQPSVKGALFNFQVEYSSAGEKHISFQEFNVVNRTYYSDLAIAENTFWGDYVEGTIIVTE